MVDAHDSKSCGGNLMRVRLSPSAPRHNLTSAPVAQLDRALASGASG